ncbi:MAG: ABC transporter permease [Acidobacteria bacterium]|nr:ABC transporter permease [Acidobacteriota bacterium]
MNSIRQNLRFAIRQLLRNPGFTLTVVLTLALSIGANTAIFSIVNALMLRSLPYPQPERMGTLFQLTQGPNPADEQRWIDGTQWDQLRDNVPSLNSATFASLASGANLESSSKQIAYIHNGRVSQHYFDVLGMRPAMGRNFSQAEDAPSGPKAAILSYELWRSTFNSDRSLIGSAIRLKGEPYAVIGILPQNAITPLNADVYTSLQPGPHGEGNGTNFGVIFRLNDGATWQQADAEINRAWSARISQIESRNPSAKIHFYTVPFQKGVTSELRPQAIGLMAAAGFILLIACANLAGLTLVRMARRLPELATRLAIGASRWQILRQLWIENLLLACIGGAAGVGIGFLALRGLLSLLPEDFLPVSGVSLDARVLAFTTIVTLFTSVLFGMLPALSARRVDLRSSLASRGTASGHSTRIRQALIAGEVALTVVLLAGSGLLIRTLIHLQTLPPGFNPDGVMTAKASLDDARYKDAPAFQRLMTNSIAAMQRIPGVKSAAVGLTLPYERTLNDGILLHDGPQNGKNVGADVVYVTPQFFDVLQMPISRGRAFTDADGPNARPVVIINSTFARKFFPGLNPVGLVLAKNALIVGVVSDTQLSSGLNPTAPIQSEETIYIPAAQVAAPMLMVHVWFQPSWVVRTSAPVEGLTEQMQRALSSVAPGLPFSGFYRMNDLQAKALSMQRIEVALLATMAGLALLLSAIGIFALVASLVTQRTRDIGIRIALGSTLRQAIAQISASGIGATAAGLLIGLALCAGVLPVMRSVLYGVGVYDIPSLATVFVALTLVSLIAATVPALRIAKIDPARTLRED